MALQKQAINVSFGQGVDTKTDPNQVQLGKFISLTNAVFDSAGLLRKRNGFERINPTPNNDTTVLTTQKGNLVALGNQLQAYSPTTQQWINKGNFEQITIEIDQLVRSTNSQSACDVAVGASNAACTVYFDSSGDYYYAISDSITGEVIVSPVQLPSGATLARVCTLSNNFIITYLISILGIKKIQYIKIPFYSPELPSPPVDLANDVNSLTEGYDIISANNNMYFAYSSSFSGGSVKIAILSGTFIIGGAFPITGYTADLISLSADLYPAGNPTPTNPNIYLTFVTGTDVYSAIFDFLLNPLPAGAVTQIATGYTINHLTSAAFNDVNHVYYQITNTYSFSSVRTDYLVLQKVDINNVVVGLVDPLILSVGLGSKAAFYKGVSYVLSNYGGAQQPTYFLINEYGKPVAKLAYSNGVQYASTQVLPQINYSILDGIPNFSVGYLYKSLVAPINKQINAASTSGIYTQTGINIGRFYFNNGSVTSNDVAGGAHITGGIMWLYDGAAPVEHGFLLYPEDIGFTDSNGGGLQKQQYFYQVCYEWTDIVGNIHRSAPSIPVNVNLTNSPAAPITFTGTFASGDTVIVAVATTGLFVGQVLTDTTNPTFLQAGTRITAINGLNVEISLPTTGASNLGGDTIQTVNTCSVTLDIPTLRVTYKTAPNDARIVIYRWSTANPVFYQITSIPNPLVNDPTVDSVQYVDTQNDSTIIGNLVLYTTGGVLENIAAPPSNLSTMYRSRLWVVDAENPNVLWYSKPILQATPVEFSDLQTFYCTPTIGSQGPTGVITAVSSMDDKLIIFKENAIYYINGNGPDITGANNDFSEPVLITSTVGCRNADSIVFSPQGLLFQSNKGIWSLGRDLGTNYIGAPVEAYNEFTVLTAISAPGTNQVRFGLNNGLMLMYDYYYNQWGVFENLYAIGGVIYNKLHTLVDKFGRVFIEKPGSYLDGSTPVLMSFRSAWAKLTDLQGFQRAYALYLLGTYKSPHTMTVGIAYDYNPSVTQQTVITPLNFTPVWGGDPYWGSESPWGGPGQVEQWRVFLTKQKCESFQIVLQESFDPSYGTAAGAGFTLSGMNLIIGAKSGYFKLPAKLSTS